MTVYMDVSFPTGDIFDIKPIWSNKLSTNNYLIKLEEDYKIITDCFLDQQKLEKVIKTYYPDLTIEIHPLHTNAPTLVNLLTHTNSFLKNNDITPTELQNKLKQWDEVVGYFSKYSDIKINDIIKQTIIKTNEDKNKIDEEKINAYDLNKLRLGDNTRDFVANIKLHNLANAEWDKKNSEGFHGKTLIPPITSDNCFDASGSYLNSVELYQVQSFDQQTIDYMEITNFNDSLLETASQIYNIYFNNQFNNIFAIEQSVDFIFHNNKIHNLFPEINLISSIDLDKEKLETIKELNKDIFVNFEDAKSRVNRVLNAKIIDSKLSIDEIKNIIKKYFMININPQDCIKFTNIWTTISNEIKVSDSYVNYIKRQLPNILSDLGLQKKRLSDGIYWYGLIVKKQDEPNISKTYLNKQLSDAPLTDDEFKKLLENRNNELNSIKMETLSKFSTVSQNINKPISMVQTQLETLNDKVIELEKEFDLNLNNVDTKIEVSNKNTLPSEDTKGVITDKPTKKTPAKKQPQSKKKNSNKKQEEINEPVSPPSEEIKKVLTKKQSKNKK